MWDAVQTSIVIQSLKEDNHRCQWQAYHFWLPLYNCMGEMECEPTYRRRLVLRYRLLLTGKNFGNSTLCNILISFRIFYSKCWNIILFNITLHMGKSVWLAGINWVVLVSTCCWCKCWDQLLDGGKICREGSRWNVFHAQISWLVTASLWTV